MKEEDKYNFKLYVLCAIKNCFALGCFTLLAIIFKHWWFVFFAILFMSYTEEKEK